YVRCRTFHMYSVFFFSSRRRHTRLVSDWSSDVCSSDLHVVAPRIGGRLEALSGIPQKGYARDGWNNLLENLQPLGTDVWAKDARSEERRVGKECRSRGSA